MPTADYKKRNKKLMERIEESEDISQRNKEILSDFYRDLQVGDECGRARIYKNLQHLKKVAENTDIDFGQASEEDVKDMVMWIKKRDIAQSTKRDYKVILKRFYKWLNDGEYPEKVSFINTTEKTKNKKLPSDMLTEEDVKEMMKSADHNRDEALISLLWETGARIGELIDLRVGDLEDNKHGLKVIISGKTGPRRLPLISSVPHLRSWLNSHPEGDNPEAWLWVNVGNTNHGGKMKYRSILKMLNKIGEKAGIEKKTNPHAFRHGRATYLSQRFTEAELCEWMGWVQGSDQAQRYVHLSGKSVDSKYARLHGIEEEKGKEKSKLAPKNCPRCETEVPPNGDFCYNCGQALSREATQQIEEDKEEVSKDFTRFARENPELLEDMEDFMEMVKLIRENEDILKDLKNRIEK